MEIMWQWTLADVWDAHDVLDAYERAEAKAAEDIRKAGKKK